jgi:hypothetical protein
VNFSLFFFFFSFSFPFSFFLSSLNIIIMILALVLRCWGKVIIFLQITLTGAVLGFNCDIGSIPHGAGAIV